MFHAPKQQPITLYLFHVGMTANAKERRPSLQEVSPQLRALWVQSTTLTSSTSQESSAEESNRLSTSYSWLMLDDSRTGTRILDQLSLGFDSKAGFGITFGETDPASASRSEKGWDSFWLEAKR